MIRSHGIQVKLKNLIFLFLTKYRIAQAVNTVFDLRTDYIWFNVHVRLSEQFSISFIENC